MVGYHSVEMRTGAPAGLIDDVGLRGGRGTPPSTVGTCPDNAGEGSDGGTHMSENHIDSTNSAKNREAKKKSWRVIDIVTAAVLGVAVG